METTATRNVTNEITHRTPGRGLCLWCKRPTKMHSRGKRYRYYCNGKCFGRHQAWKQTVDAAA
jgi:hypothetical protein